MLFYATVGSNDIERARGFFDNLFKPMGIDRTMVLANGGAVYGFPGGTCVCVLPPFDGNAATVGNGTMIGLRFDSPEQIDAIHARAVELGGSCEGQPGLRQVNVPGNYNCYFRDLDGNKFTAMTLVDPELAASGRLHSVC